eukprot:8650916-Pyramimonas_sp.AAC.1
MCIRDSSLSLSSFCHFLSCLRTLLSLWSAFQAGLLVLDLRVWVSSVSASVGAVLESIIPTVFGRWIGTHCLGSLSPTISSSDLSAIEEGVANTVHTDQGRGLNVVAGHVAWPSIISIAGLGFAREARFAVCSFLGGGLPAILQ